MKSATAISIVQYFRQCGPSTVAETAKSLGKKTKSLHYHFRKLVRAGFLHEVSSRRSGARTEAILDVAADRIECGNIQSDLSWRKLICEGANGLLQLAKKDFSRAVGHTDSLSDSGEWRNIAMDRMSARLTKSRLAKVNRHLRAINKLFVDNIGSQNGQLCALTIVMTPVRDAQKDR